MGRPPRYGRRVDSSQSDFNKLVGGAAAKNIFLVMDAFEEISGTKHREYRNSWRSSGAPLLLAFLSERVKYAHDAGVPPPGQPRRTSYMRTRHDKTATLDALYAGRDLLANCAFFCLSSRCSVDK